jgi:hypothetical protein
MELYFVVAILVGLFAQSSSILAKVTFGVLWPVGLLSKLFGDYEAYRAEVIKKVT